MRARRGFSLIEVAVAAALTLTLLVLAAQTLTWVAEARGNAARRALAVEEIANALERLSAMPFDRFATAGARPLELPEHARRRLPNARFTLRVVAIAEEPVAPGEEPDARRIVVELDWTDIAGQRVAPLRVITHRYSKAPTP